jgi:hypothetical protein
VASALGGSRFLLGASCTAEWRPDDLGRQPATFCRDGHGRPADVYLEGGGIVLARFDEADRKTTG